MVRKGHVIYGASGHGKVLADMLLRTGIPLLGFVDDGVQSGKAVLTDAGGNVYAVLGSGQWILEHAECVDGVALGIGANFVRQRIAIGLISNGVRVVSVVHPAAMVSQFSVVAIGAAIMPGAVVNPGARIGVGSIVNSGAVVEHDATVGDYAHVCPNATLTGGASLGALALLGAGAVVLPGITVGERCAVGSGAVVSRDIPDGFVAMGVPARCIRLQEA